MSMTKDEIIAAQIIHIRELQAELDRIKQSVSSPFNLDSVESGKAERDRDGQNLDQVRLQDGYYLKPCLVHCSYQSLSCHTCHHFATTPEFLQQFKKQRADVLIQIELGRSSGLEHRVEKNQNMLEPINRIIQVLEADQNHYPAGKSNREHKPEEREGGAQDGG